MSGYRLVKLGISLIANAIHIKAKKNPTMLLFGGFGPAVPVGAIQNLSVLMRVSSPMMENTQCIHMRGNSPPCHCHKKLLPVYPRVLVASMAAV
jgi:hypothetical protein